MMLAVVGDTVHETAEGKRQAPMRRQRLARGGDERMDKRQQSRWRQTPANDRPAATGRFFKALDVYRFANRNRVLQKWRGVSIRKILRNGDRHRSAKFCTT
ncbi:hypothetical protein [Bacillus smithii]|uniref:hypothetical protein n=1 Tax=Bacillus smithii TaxID=1479 RepID=UPI003D24EA89